MNKALLLLPLLWMTHLALSQDQAVSTRRILPEDVVQDSIQLVRFSTNSFGVRWTYTEVGANKMLAFREAYEGQTVRILVGSFGTRPHKMPFRPTYYAQWKEGWFKYRTDKFINVSEEDAKKIVAGLKGK